jgi:peptide/nickel transport system ATP-binding protein
MARGTIALEPLLSVENLHVHFVTSRGVVRAVEGLTYDVRPGEMVALVGESGCGKSVSSLAVMRLLARPAGRIAAGAVRFDGRDLLRLTEDEMREIRGRDIAMIFQEPMTSLNPVLPIGFQITEPLFMHQRIGAHAARARALELLGMVGIPDGERRLGQYPHQFSGGMRQRVMIAIALACNPKLIIADEPTTALDVTIQAQILELMRDLSRRLGIAMVMITHNLGVVARYADRVNVMYAARLAEEAAADALFARCRAWTSRAARTSRPSTDCRRTCSSRRRAAASRRAAPQGCRSASARRRRSSKSSPAGIRPACAPASWGAREHRRSACRAAKPASPRPPSRSRRSRWWRCAASRPTST